VIVCQCFAAGQWFSLGTPVSFKNKSDCHDIAEILLNVLLNTITKILLSGVKHHNPNPLQVRLRKISYIGTLLCIGFNMIKFEIENTLFA
jgi:hypothetical protein